jgi:hypothetical protein
MKIALLLATFALFTVGCGGTDPAPLQLPAAQSTGARLTFEQKVYPELQLTCAFCHAAANNPVHAPQWMSFDAKTSYDNVEKFEGLIAWPENSALLLKGEHTGPALTNAQGKVVRAWLMEESDERGLEPPPPPDKPSAPALTVDEALAQFGSCMLLDDFKTTKTYELAFQQTTGWGPCRGCHSSGWAGAFIDDDVALTFKQNQLKPYILKLATFQTENGAFKDIVPAKRFHDKGSEPCAYTGEQAALCHPKYVLLPEIADGIDAFFVKTYDRWKKAGGKCAAP